jgi:hypothetical protein
VSSLQMHSIDLPIRDLSIRHRAGHARRQRPPPTDLAARLPREVRALYDLSARALGLHRLPRPVAIGAESARWSAFLDALEARVAAGSVSSAQRSTLLSIWERALAKQPSLRRPAVGISEAGLLRASWSFADIPGRVFSLEIHRGGAIDWFYRDATTDTSRGSDDELLHELPDEAFELLAARFGASAIGTR